MSFVALILLEYFRRLARSVRALSAAAAHPAPRPMDVRSEDRDIQDMAAALDEGRTALGRALPGDLRRLDARLRSRSPWDSEWIVRLSSVSPRAVQAAVEAFGGVDAAIVLAAHRNGYVREAAVPLLGRHPTPLSVGMLVVRSGDWVLEVRSVSQAVLRDVVAREGPDVLLPCLALIQEMSGGDARSRPFAVELLDLAAAASPAGLRGALRGTDRRARRAAARLLARTAGALAALDDALNQGDPIALALVAEAALADAPLAVVERLSRPPTIPRVRARALARLLEVSADGAAAHAERALMDRTASVRAVAQRHLRRVGSDVATLYAAHLLTPALASGPTAVAVRGLTEAGSRARSPLGLRCREDRPEPLPGVHHPRPLATTPLCCPRRPVGTASRGGARRPAARPRVQHVEPLLHLASGVRPRRARRSAASYPVAPRQGPRPPPPSFPAALPAEPVR
jgi:hypothetical protein